MVVKHLFQTLTTLTSATIPILCSPVTAKRSYFYATLVISRKQDRLEKACIPCNVCQQNIYQSRSKNIVP